MKYSASHSLIKLSVLFQDEIEEGMQKLLPAIKFITQKVKVIFKESKNTPIGIEELLYQTYQMNLDSHFEQDCQSCFPNNYDAVKKERIIDAAKTLRQLLEGDESFFYKEFEIIFKDRDAQFIEQYIFTTQRIVIYHLVQLVKEMISKRRFDELITATHSSYTYLLGKTKEEADACCDKIRLTRERMMHTGFACPKNRKLKI